MYLHKVLTLVLVCGSVAGVRDFFAGWFNDNDLLIAEDTLYKERSQYSSVTAHYARDFKCPISYYRVLDRIGAGRGPIIDIVGGGLRKNFLVLRLTSAFNYPIAVNIYIACANKKGDGPMFTTAHWSRGPRGLTEAATITEAAAATAVAEATIKQAAEAETTEEPKKYLRDKVNTIDTINEELETNTMNEEAPIVAGRVEGLNSIGE